jgi:(p)ppGpp synthase/HD superfamily hydrolase
MGLSKETESSKESLLISNKNPEELITERKERTKILNNFCEKFYSNAFNDKQQMVVELEKVFGLNKENQILIDIILFAIEAFRGYVRKDGNFLATHSLELFQKARDFGIEDFDVFVTVLLHDTVEDTDITISDIKDLEKSSEKPFSHYVKVMTEKRETGDRNQDLLNFIDQLKTAKDVPEEDKRVIIISELIDRIDDLSDIGYLKTQLIDPEKKEKAVKKLQLKLAKCRYTIDQLTSDSKDPEILSLKAIFDKIYNHHMETFGFEAEEINQIKRDSYQRFEKLNLKE